MTSFSESEVEQLAEEATEGEEIERKEELKTRWAQLEALDHTMRQIISRAVAPEGVIDVFEAAGLEQAEVLSATWIS